MDEDLDNFRAALSWAAESGDAELGLRLSSALAWFWLRRGRLTEGRASIERALRLGTEPAAAAAGAFHVSGGLAWAQGDWEAAASRLSEAVARFKELEDSDDKGWRDGWLSSALSTYSLERLDRGEIEEALALAAESVSLVRRYEGFSELPRALAALGMARMAAGDLVRLTKPLNIAPAD